MSNVKTEKKITEKKFVGYTLKGAAKVSVVKIGNLKEAKIDTRKAKACGMPINSERCTKGVLTDRIFNTVRPTVGKVYNFRKDYSLSLGATEAEYQGKKHNVSFRMIDPKISVSGKPNKKEFDSFQVVKKEANRYMIIK